MSRGEPLIRQWNLLKAMQAVHYGLSADDLAERLECSKREVLECLEKGRPQEVQSRIFRKSFSTKSRDRGIGTYSIKLFTEKYLKGKVWFTSTPEQGTTIYIRIPNSNGTG